MRLRRVAHLLDEIAEDNLRHDGALAVVRRDLQHKPIGELGGNFHAQMCGQRDVADAQDAAVLPRGIVAEGKTDGTRRSLLMSRRIDPEIRIGVGIGRDVFDRLRGDER